MRLVFVCNISCYLVGYGLLVVSIQWSEISFLLSVLRSDMDLEVLWLTKTSCTINKFKLN